MTVEGVRNEVETRGIHRRRHKQYAITILKYEGRDERRGGRSKKSKRKGNDGNGICLKIFRINYLNVIWMLYRVSLSLKIIFQH